MLVSLQRIKVSNGEGCRRSCKACSSLRISLALFFFNTWSSHTVLRRITWKSTHYYMFIWLLFVLLFHVINDCFFACVGDNPSHYPLPRMSLPFPFLSTCCCSPFAAALFLLHIIFGPNNFETGLCWSTVKNSYFMFICLLFVLLFHVINDCFFACVGDNPGHYPLPHMGELFAFLSTCCSSPFAAALCLLHILSGPHKFQTGLCCVEARLKKVISCSYACCLYCYFMLETPVSLHVLVIIQAIIRCPIWESSLPFSSPAAALCLLHIISGPYKFQTGMWWNTVEKVI